MKLVNEEKSWLEWLVFAVSLVLILALMIYLINDAIQDRKRPPEIKITLGQPVVSTHGYVVPVEVTNSGDQSAQALELEISVEGAEPEEASLSFDFLSSGELRKGWAGFSGKPEGKLTSRVVGYRTEQGL